MRVIFMIFSIIQTKNSSNLGLAPLPIPIPNAPTQR
jgi:hypothetical protein